MAMSFIANFTRLTNVLTADANNLTRACGALGLTSFRLKSHKSGTTTRNKLKKTRGKNRGPKRWDGEYVEKGMVIYRQLGLKVYPGENVGCGRDLTLFALARGRVMKTHEKLSPYPQSPLYPAVQAGRVVYKEFYHVIPEHQPQIFKLVSQT